MKKKLFLLLLLAIVTATLSVSAAAPPQRAIELYNQGIDFYQGGQVAKSVSAFTDAIKLAPEFYEAYYNLGQIQVSQDKIDDAIKTYTSIYRLRPGDDENLSTLANLLYKRGYLANALTYYRQIPATSQYYKAAQVDIEKVTKRQKELEAQLQVTARTDKLAAAQKSIEQKFADQNQIAGLAQSYDSQVAALGYTTTQTRNPDDLLKTINPDGSLTSATAAATSANLKPRDDALSPQGGALKANPFTTPSTPDNAQTLASVVTSANSVVYEGIRAPSGVTVDRNGNMYVASYSENTIYKITPQNQKSVFAGPNVLGGPIGVAVDNAGNVYVANYVKGDILKITPGGTTSVFLKIKSPYCLNIVGNTLFITEQATNTVVKHTL